MPRAPLLRRAAPRRTRLGDARRRGPRDREQQRSAVDREPLDVDRLQPMPVEEMHRARRARSSRGARDRWCRTRSARSCRRGTGTRAPRRRRPPGSRGCPSTKPRRSATCASTLLACTTSARLPFGDQLARQLETEELATMVGMPALLDGDARRRSAPARSPAPERPACLVVLQEVAVVAGDLDGQRRGPERRSAISRPTSSRACASIVSENDEK